MGISKLLQCKLHGLFNSYYRGLPIRRATYGRIQIFTSKTNTYVDIGLFNLRQLRRKPDDHKPKYKTLFFIKPYQMHLILKTSNLFPSTLRIRCLSMQSKPVINRVVPSPETLVSTWRAWCWDTYLDFYYFSDPMWARTYAHYRRNYTSRYCNRTPRPFTRKPRNLTVPQQRARRVVLLLPHYVSVTSISNKKGWWYSYQQSDVFGSTCTMDINDVGSTQKGCLCFIRSDVRQLSVLFLALQYRNPPKFTWLKPLWNCFPRKQTRAERLDYAFKARHKAMLKEERLNTQLRRKAQLTRSLEKKTLKLSLKQEKQVLLQRQLVERQELATRSTETLKLFNDRPLKLTKPSDLDDSE